MAAKPRRLERPALRLLTAADAACNRLYGSRYNPLYQSGTIVVALLGVLIATGLWLIFFYRVGAPYSSVAGLTSDVWFGRWIRSVHRYASDAAVVFTLVHLWRMYAQGRSWGPRALAWTSGVVALGLLFVCGLTGYVMVWDSFGQLVAQEGARMLDTLPILSEPIGRAFTGEQELAGAFFFVNLFAHIAIPLGLGLALWLHVSRVARPTLLPPRRLTWVLVGALVVAALLRPAALGSAATPFHLPESVRVDWLYAFWVPLVRATSPAMAFLALTLAVLLLLSVPLFTKRRAAAAPPPSVVDEDICTGCRQCSLDCPYEAITMIDRPGGGRSAMMARVDPTLCVSCGICSGSCAPMGVGPPGRTGRDQLADIRPFIAGLDAGRTVVVCCDRGARGWRESLEEEGAVVHEVDCAGNLHTSVIELLVRGGAAGVLVIACPPRDCWNREGARWLSERVYDDREAELQARVDRRRVRIASANASETAEAVAALRAFMADTTRLDHPQTDGGEIALVCDTETAAIAVEEA
jgi:ferredoxin